MEYNEDGELVAFALRPKIATYVFTRDESDISSLKEILKVVMYMNRLLLEGENLILGRRKIELPIPVTHPAYNLRTPLVNHQDDIDDDYD